MSVGRPVGRTAIVADADHQRMTVEQARMWMSDRGGAVDAVAPALVTAFPLRRLGVPGDTGTLASFILPEEAP
jgi:hypothetical protein